MEQGHQRSGPDGITRRDVLTGVAGATAAAALIHQTAGARQATPAATPAPVSTATPGQVKFGFVLSHEQFPTPELLELGVAAEDAGFDELWTSDHFQPWQDNEGHAMFPWITLALLGARTSKITFGTGVTCPTYRHHPSQVAQAFASLGILYPGRVYLGVGTGEALNEQAATGVWAPYQERADRWVEAVQFIRQLWGGDFLEFAGQYYQTPVAKLYDVPELPVPIYMAASGPNSARLVGENGDGWICGAADLMMKPELRPMVLEAAQGAGRNPDAFPVRAETFVVVGGQAEAEYAAARWRFTPNSWTRNLLWDPDPRSIQAKAEAMTPTDQLLMNWPVSTDPSVHADFINQVIEGGATHVYIHSGQQDQRRVIDFFGDQVLPQFS